MMMVKMLGVLISTLLFAAVRALDCTAPCNENDICVYHANVNLMAGQLGYYTFDECPDLISPTIGMEIGKTYVFQQRYLENYYHPMGFSYFADGAHAEVDELEPVVQPPGTSTDCASIATCPAPMYWVNDTYVGTYSNNEALVGFITTGEDNFGLDDYEPLFFLPIDQWSELGPFDISLRFDNAEYTEDIFYFCHIHQFMTGRIKLLVDGVPINAADTPELPNQEEYYDSPSEYDKTCGTFGLGEFQLPNPECPKTFVCDATPEIEQFSDCIDSMNCAQAVGMTTKVSAQSELALFIHQMIPHHENAINMAKALLKTGDLDECEDILEETSKCAMKNIAISIINEQNFQIQSMRSVLEALDYPMTDDCKVEVSTALQRSG